MTFEQFPWLTAIVLFPLMASLLIPALPDKYNRVTRWYALSIGLIEVALITYAFWTNYDISTSGFQLVETYNWVPQLRLNWSVAVDGLSMPLVVLTGLVTTLAIFSAWKVTTKPKLFYFLMLVMYSAQIGVFVARDLLMFFFTWELELVPVYLLIAIWGGQQRLYAATKFILYTAIGSIFILVAGLAMAFYGDTITFDLQALAQKHYTLSFELVMYAALLIAYGVKLPIFPLHTWLPDAHSEAPAPVSMLLAGIMLKMGGYALIRMNVEMFPEAHVYFAPLLAVLGVVNIIYAALNAFAQEHLKRRMAYSSISHMGFVLIGIASFSELGMSGAMVQMISHGLIAAVLFFLTGVTYDRTHTLAMADMGGIAKQMPTVFALFTIASMASLALPGMSGFVGEISVFLGLTTSGAYTNAFKVTIVLLSAVGIILTPIYLLSMLRRVFYGAENPELVCHMALADANPREVFIAACLLLPIIGIGLYPKLVTQTYDAKTTAVVAEARAALPSIAQKFPTRLFAQAVAAPAISDIRNSSITDTSGTDSLVHP